jgi:ATP-dependent Lon protease
MVKAIGVKRFTIDRVLHRAVDGLILTAECSVFNEIGSDADEKLIKQGEKFKKLKQSAIKFCTLGQQIATTSARQQLYKLKIDQIQKMESPIQLTYFVCSMFYTPSKTDMQRLLDTNDSETRIQLAQEHLDHEIQQLEDKKKGPVSGLKGMLGMQNAMGSENDEVKELEAKLDSMAISEEAKKIYKQEIKKLKQIGSRSQEYHVSMNYLQTMADLPWGIYDPENLDPKTCQEQLDKDHFGLDSVKTRIIQFLAVRKLTKNNKGTIMCFHGPPGVGKTSLGRSIAESLKRKFYRIALGGVRDEAEIRGHRRTYLGSMPGVIISSLKKIKSSNPVILLDEIDKMGRDARGDPGAALLGVLDPA